MSDMLSIALSHAERGWAVFPLRPRDKKPLPGSRAFKDATTDPEQIMALWQAHPNSNVGISCGSASDLLVIDVDVDAAAGKDGLASFERLARDLDLPETRMARTGRGGIHFYFSNPRGLGCSNAALKEKYQHIDVRGDGGYVVAPGSIHASGARYEWINASTPVASLPDNLYALLASRRAAEASQQGLSATRISEGGRNAALTSFAGHLRKHGCDAETIEAALQVKNRKECAPPLPEHEVRTIARSVARYPASISNVGSNMRTTWEAASATSSCHLFRRSGTDASNCTKRVLPRARLHRMLEEQFTRKQSVRFLLDSERPKHQRPSLARRSRSNDRRIGQLLEETGPILNLGRMA